MKDAQSETPPALLRDRARSLRAAQTEVERRLWQRLRNRQLNGAKFRRQQPIGSYIADFFCLDAKLVIELDGSQHAERPTQYLDERRTEYLENQGYRVVRFWNEEVMDNIDGVLKTIASLL